jgi:hypothetical protein
VPAVAWCYALLVARQVKPELPELVMPELGQELVMLKLQVLLGVVALPPTLRQYSMLQP